MNERGSVGAEAVGPDRTEDGGSGGSSGRDRTPPGSGLARREFLRVAGSALAMGSVVTAVPGGSGLAAAERAGARPHENSGRPGPGRPSTGGGGGLRPEALGNAEPPALHFCAEPGGPGALFERLRRERGERGFDSLEIPIPPWEGPRPGSDEEIAYLPVARLAAMIRDRVIGPVELTRIYLERLERYDPTFLVAVTIIGDTALDEARRLEAELDAGLWRGPLHGIPWGVKDLFAVRGTPTTWGAEEFADRVIDEDAAVVERLREAGAVLVAKLATGQFARGDEWFRGKTRNPWNPEEGSSGSSAGPAAATVAGLVGFAIGTETLGSIVSPARRCGVTAMRPTFGRVSRHGGMVLSWSMDKVGPFCRTVEGCAMVFEAMHGADPRDPSSLTTPFRYQPPADLSGYRIGATADAPSEALRSLEALGAEVVSMPELPGRDRSSLNVESAAAFDFHVLATAQDGSEPDAWEDRFQAGRSVLALDHVQSLRHRLVAMQELAEVMEEMDAFVSPSGELGLTNETGHPAVVVPYTCSEGEAPQPECLTLVGRPFEDDRLLGIAHAFQESGDWHLRRPDLP
ncbi:MAG: amidase [Gemmatimonadota bacterium]